MLFGPVLCWSFFVPFFAVFAFASKKVLFSQKFFIFIISIKSEDYDKIEEKC
jgi:hypothetical protein